MYRSLVVVRGVLPLSEEMQENVDMKDVLILRRLDVPILSQRVWNLKSLIIIILFCYEKTRKIL